MPRAAGAAVCRFPGLLQELEASKDALGVDSYGLAVTTLEEVFLTVSAQARPMHKIHPLPLNPKPWALTATAWR